MAVITAKEIWNIFVHENKIESCEYDVWSFATDVDYLANLVAIGQKTATSSAYPLYEVENEPLPHKGEYSVILDSNNNAVCIIQTKNVEIIPFNKITEEQAYKEGEGDKSLHYWQKKHKNFFEKCLKDYNLEFTFNMKVVFEEFVVVYKL